MEILARCKQRDDAWGMEVEGRVQSALSDLHAEDGRYHRDCYAKFYSKLSNMVLSTPPEDQALLKVLAVLRGDKSKICNSVEVHRLYVQCGGTRLSRTPLVKCLEQEMTPDLLVLSSPGVACILVFRSKASAQLRIEDDTENDCLFESVKRVAAVIKSECPKHASKQYQTRISKQQALADCSPTLVSLLAQISNNLDRSLSAALIGNIITSFVSKQFTPLQIALSVLLGRHHKTIDTLYAYGLTSTYDELRRFKISAASDMVAQQSKLSATFEHRPTDTAVLDFTPHHVNTHSTCRLRQVL